MNKFVPIGMITILVLTSCLTMTEAGAAPEAETTVEPEAETKVAQEARPIMKPVVEMDQMDPGYRSEAVRQPSKRGIPYAGIAFESREFLMMDEDRKAAVEGRKPDYSRLPEIGIFIARLQSSDIGSADSKHLALVYFDSGGNLIGRDLGLGWYIDFIDLSGDSIWYSYSMFPAPPDTTFPITVRAVHAFYHDDYTEWVISKVE